MPTNQTANHQYGLVGLKLKQRLGLMLVSLGVLGGFGALYILQRVGVDVGGFFPLCGLKQRTGWPCPTCGMTTAVLAFARGELAEAFWCQPAAALICMVLVVAALAGMIAALVGVYPRWVQTIAHMRVRYILLILGIILALGWAVTLWQTFLEMGY